MSDPLTIDLEVGAALRAARLASGLRQDDLARKLGVDRSTVARYETGERAMSVSMLVLIARTLNRPISSLLPGGPADPALIKLVQLLEQRPDLLRRVLDVIDVSLQHEREEQSLVHPTWEQAQHDSLGPTFEEDAF